MIITYCYCNNELLLLIIAVIMDPLLHTIITVIMNQYYPLLLGQ